MLSCHVLHTFAESGEQEPNQSVFRVGVVRIDMLNTKQTACSIVFDPYMDLLPCV